MTSTWFPFNFTLPSLQNLTPPLSIQRRFISFLLKRSLGHLLKPGQLDINQIEAQFGDGVIEVKELELDDAAINAFLTEAPVQLRSGSIGTVTVRIPWSNPLSGNISLSISGLMLDVCISDNPPNTERETHTAVDLSQSVASAAETFVHHELTQTEESELRNSIHVDTDIPGGSKAFSGTPGSFEQFGHESTLPYAADPEGISIFAGLLERLLARFEFDATSTQITLTDASKTSLTLSIQRVAYTASNTDVVQASGELLTRETRNVHISDIKLTAKVMDSHVDNPKSRLTPSAMPVTLRQHTVSESSDSEMDEETQMMMSQSLVSLPPRLGLADVRPSSPALSTISSAASSLYQSAASAPAIPSRPVTPSSSPDGSDTTNASEQTLLVTSDPIILRLTMPPAYIPSSTSVSNDASQPTPSSTSQGAAKFELDISLGVIAVALHARNINTLQQLLEALPSSRTPAGRSITKASVGQKSSGLADQLECSLSCKGIVVLLLGSSKDAISDEGAQPVIHQFFQRPLSQIRLPYGCVRLHLDKIQANGSLLHSAVNELEGPPITIASLTIMDLSVLVFHAIPHMPGTSPKLKRNSISPVLITDINLPQSYRSPSPNDAPLQQDFLFHHRHPHSEEEKSVPLPCFDVVDWTSEKEDSHGTSLRPWRYKAHPPHPSRVQLSRGPVFVSKIGLSTSPTRSTQPLASSPPHERLVKSVQHKIEQPSALSLAVSTRDNGVVVAVRVVPLHVFLDLRAVETLSTFLEDALPKTEPSVASTELPSPIYNYEFTQDQREILNHKINWRSHEEHVMDTPRPKTRRQELPKGDLPAAEKGGVIFDVQVPLVRLEVRTPCPRNRQPRSGSLVVDVHSLSIATGPPTQGPRQERTVRIEAEDIPSGVCDQKGASVTVKLRRLLIAYAPRQDTKAHAILSLGVPQNRDRETAEHVAESPTILLRPIDASSTNHGNAPTLVIYVPSLHMNIEKNILDGLQIWADDVSQWSERTFGNESKSSKTSTNTSPTTTRNPSLIGSRYFVQRTGSGATESDMASTLGPKDNNQEFVVKAIVTEAFVRLAVPVVTPTHCVAIRTLDISSSGLESLVELKPEGKEETRISLNVKDVDIRQTYKNSVQVLLTSNKNINRKSSVVKLRFRSVSLPGTAAKESKLNVFLHGLLVDLPSEMEWLTDLAAFVKNPPGTFESVVPSERTSVSGSIIECSLRVSPSNRLSSMVLSLGDVEASTELMGDSPETCLRAFVRRMAVLLDGDSENSRVGPSGYFETDAESWMKAGHALLITLDDLDLQLKRDASVSPPDTRVGIGGMKLYVHLCADSIAGIVRFATDIQSQFAKPNYETAKPKKGPANVSAVESSNVLRSLDESAFRRPPVIGPLPDMIEDDLPTNPEYLDASFGAAAGLRPIEDDDDEFYPEDDSSPAQNSTQIISRHGGETIKMLLPSIDYVEHFYDTVTPSSVDYASEYGETSTKVRAENCDIHVLLYEGYDWERTRRAIQEEVKRVKRRLAKIRQLLSNGQTYDPNVDEVNTVLFNSVYVGLDEEAEEFEPEALIAKIDEELHSDTDLASESSWQSFNPGIASKPERHVKTVLRGKRLERSKAPSIEFSLDGMTLEFDQYRPEANLASRLLFTIKDLEIRDHIRTSTWSKFLTSLRSDSRGNVRETDSDMVRVELQMLLPYKGREEQEARLKAKILPLRLHVDQDALDFLKKFFSFKDPDAAPSAPAEDEFFFQHVEIFPVDLKLDYKPRRVDYRALKEGKTIELMNFFHFDGAEMTLRHLTLKGISGWPRMFDTLNDLWTPDVKANQLAEVISGVSPIRSAVNVGSGVADLILLPIAQYKKDGRIIRGLQKGTTAFVKSTAIEAIKLGARLATGTQVVLEQAESVLGGQYKDTITAEAMAFTPGFSGFEEGLQDEDSDSGDQISKYAEQPTNITEGVQSAYKSLSQNIKSAGQTILAVPMEVYERSGKEGPARAVIRAVPIAVLKPLIGASEAVSKTLLGIHGTLNPEAQLDTAVKYKHRG